MGFSARPSAFKQSGGGFLNNVDATITGYTFTSEFPGGGSKKRNSDFTPLYFIPSFKVDGSDDESNTTIFVGSADDFSIEDDGKTLVPVDESQGLRANSDFAFFIASLVQGGFPESNLPEDKINYEAIIGARVRLVQERDAELTAKLGKKKGKNGKEYDRTRLKVQQVLGLGKAPAAKSTAPGGADIETLATQSLVALLKKAPNGTMLKKKLPVAIINQLGAKHPQRNEVKDLVTSEDFLAAGDDWAYDSETQEITLAA